MTEYSDILVNANSGAQLDAVEEHTLRNLGQLAEDHAFLEVLRQSQLGGDLKTAELTFVSLLYRNPAARTTWLQIADDMERYVDPLRTTESLARTERAAPAHFDHASRLIWPNLTRYTSENCCRAAIAGASDRFRSSIGPCPIRSA
jgi:hypothetical protein